MSNNLLPIHNLSVIQALKGYLYPSHNYCADFPMTDRKEA